MDERNFSRPAVAKKCINLNLAPPLCNKFCEGYTVEKVTNRAFAIHFIPNLQLSNIKMLKLSSYTKSGFEIRPLLGMNQQTLLPEIEFFQIWLSFFEKNWHDDVTVTIKIWRHHWVFQKITWVFSKIGLSLSFFPRAWVFFTLSFFRKRRISKPVLNEPSI